MSDKIICHNTIDETSPEFRYESESPLDSLGAKIRRKYGISASLGSESTVQLHRLCVVLRFRYVYVETAPGVGVQQRCGFLRERQY